MHIHLIAIGTKMPSWIDAGFSEYARRLPPEFKLQLTEIPAQKRLKNSNIPQVVEIESEKLISAAKPYHRTILLDVKGKAWSTETLANELNRSKEKGESIALLVGGPDGVSETCRNRCQEKWSLSSLTLPHPLVRIIIAEQVYRAWSLLVHHPYHRG